MRNWPRLYGWQEAYVRDWDAARAKHELVYGVGTGQVRAFFPPVPIWLGRHAVAPRSSCPTGTLDQGCRVTFLGMVYMFY